MTPLRVAAAVLACLSGLLAAAALALADGEDDSTFGSGGTAFSILIDDPSSDGLPLGSPYADQAPDGSVVQAALLTRNLPGRGKAAPPELQLVVTKMSAAGVLSSGFDGDGIATAEVDAEEARLLDLRVLDNGTIVLAVAATPREATGTGTTATTTLAETRGAPVQPSELRLYTFPADGSTSASTSTPNAGPCGYALAAEITATGEAYVLWERCETLDVLSRTGSGFQTNVPEGVDGVDVTLGPDDAPYLLGEIYDGPEERGTASETDAVVAKYGADLTPAPGYQGLANPFDGVAIDISVDGDGRAAVWYGEELRKNRGLDEGRWTVGRLNADGTADTTFGTGGVAAFEGTMFASPNGNYFGGDLGCLSFGTDNCRIWQLKSQPDGKVLLSGPAQQMATRGGMTRLHWTLARFDASGKADVSWDDEGVGTPPAGDGIKHVHFEGPAANQSYFGNVGTPELQSDYKVLLPFEATDWSEVESPARVAELPSYVHVGVERINSSPPSTVTTPTDTTATTTTPVQTQPPVTQTQASQTAPPKPVTVPSKSCTSRRAFKIRLRTGRRKSEESAIKTAEVRVNGKKVPVSKEARLRSVVNLKNLPKGRFSVSIKLVLADGGKVSETRRYRTCTKKIESELGPLRTSPPKKRGGK